MTKMLYAVVLTIFSLLNNALGDSDAVANYTGCEVISLKPQTNSKEETIMNLIPMILELDFWSAPFDNQRPYHIQICPGFRRTFANLKNLPHTVEIPDIQTLIDEQAAERELLGRFEAFGSSAEFALDQYHNLAEIENFFQALLKEFPTKVEILNIGTTLQENSLKVIKVSENNESNETKPIIWIDSGIHAREWVSVASTLYLLHQIVTTTNNFSQTLLRDFDWHIMPVANPDGYKYSWTNDRLWRKNRSFNSPFCRGVDINRNFDVDFKGGGLLSGFACSQEYRGQAPFSERESKAIKQHLTEIKDQLKVFITLHSYGQLWLHSYGYQYAKAKDYAEMNRLARVAASAIEKYGGVNYAVGSINHQLYHVSGSSTDWVYEALGIKYSFAVELRDRGLRGFLLPRNHILPTAKELAVALEAIATDLTKKTDQ